ncbi:25561_t:CDS:2 [Dentiscutata erythropus]|uniref:25561_t:CDS:1 n=1 Tax=Dentiscutata erythropus TaxID=1348616 RepID=A0A9N8ZC70_9GLOM|nr:25561_t:CDS:2 [Dentiscutata erythropus]
MEEFEENLKLNYPLCYRDRDFEHLEPKFTRGELELEKFTDIRVYQPDAKANNNAWSSISDTNTFDDPETTKILIPIFKVKCANPPDESTKDNKELFIAMKVWVGGFLTIEKYPEDLEFDKLKACINFAIDAVQKGQDILFENSKIIPIIKDSEGKTIGDMKKLYAYIETLYNYDRVFIIAYEEVKRVSDKEKIDKLLVPKISNHKEIKINEWLQNNLFIKVSNWIEKYQLNHGLVISSGKISISHKPSIKISTIPSIKVIQKTKKEKYNFSNADKQSPNSICYQYKIINEQIEITLSDEFRPTESLKQAVKHAINCESSNVAAKKLANVFTKYGHIFCKKITMGKIIDVLSDKNVPKRSMMPVEENGIDAWSKYLFKNPDLWCVVDRHEMVPVFKIFEEEQEKIRSMMKIDEISIFKPLRKETQEVLRTGIICLDNNDGKSYPVKFNHCLKGEEVEGYKVVGTVINDDGSRRSDLILQFKNLNTFFNPNILLCIFINNSDSEKYIDFDEVYIVWILIGNSDNENKNVPVLSGEVSMNPEQKNFSITVKDKLSPNHVLITSCDYNDIKLKDWSDRKIDMEIIPKEQMTHTNSSVQWFVIYSELDIFETVYNNEKINLEWDLFGYKLGSVDTKNSFMKPNFVGYIKSDLKFIEAEIRSEREYESGVNDKQKPQNWLQLKSRVRKNDFKSDEFMNLLDDYKT